MADGDASNSTVVAMRAQQPLEPRLKRKHLAPMLSLDNVYNDEQLWAWLKRIPKVLDEVPEGTTTKVTIYTEPKLDGVSLSLRYRKQPSSSSTSTYELEWASTRGDGQNGQDVTFAVRSMNQTIPALLTTLLSSLPDTIEIRGEVVLPNSEFDKISQLMPNISFSNPRNAASGILLRKETEEEVAQTEAVHLRCKLQFYAYDMVAGEALDLDGDEVQQHLEQMGFSIPSPVTETVLNLNHSETMDEWSNDSISPMLSFYQALQAHRGGDENSQSMNKHISQGYDWGDFEMDGCVHKVSQFQLRQLLGRSMKSPKWAVAHKFSPQAVVTKLLNVTVQVGRTGALTPVAILDPVDIGGVTIQRATLHNFGHLQQVLGGTTTAVGTSVLVRRAGDVIPQVVQRIGNAQASQGDEGMISLEAPKHCPACSSPVVLDEIMSSGVGQVLRCGGPPLLCPPRAVTSLAHAFSRDAMDITGLSEARIQQLMDAGLLRLPSDLYRLGDEGWARIQELPRWGSKSCQNLRSAADRVSTTGVSLSRFIYSLGIRHLGKGSSELVASCYVTKEAFMAALDDASKELETVGDGYVEPGDQPFSALQGQLGVGPVLIQSLVNFSKSRELVDAAKALSQAVRVLDEETTAEERSKTDPTAADGTQLPWKGLRVVFTGSIPDYSRTEAQKLAKRLGAKSTPESVSKSTDLVIFGDKGGRKLEAARSLGIRTMIAEEFVRLVDETLKDGT
jgi:DNA ligase (NAD+)